MDRYRSKYRLSSDSPLEPERRGEPESYTDDVGLSRALRKSQDRCQDLAVDKEELQRKLTSLESENSRMAYAMDRAIEENKEYAEERVRLTDELARVRSDAKEAREKLSLLRQDATENKRIADDTRNRLENIVNQQRAQIERIEKFAESASADTAEHLKAIGALSEGFSVFIRERVNLMGMLSETLRIMQTLFYDPTPFMRGSIIEDRVPSRDSAMNSSSIGTRKNPTVSSKTSTLNPYIVQTTKKSASPPVVPPGPTLEQKREMSDLKEIGIQLEKEIRDAATVYSAILSRLSSAHDRGQRYADVLGDEASGKQTLAVCEAVLEAGNMKPNMLPEGGPVSVDWSKEKSTLLHAISVMEAKFQQLMKIRGILSTREAALPSLSTPSDPIMAVGGKHDWRKY